MGRPCTKCPPTTVQSCCGFRNLRMASILIGVFKLLFFTSGIIGAISVMSGKKTGNSDTDSLSTGMLILVMLTSIGFLFLAALLLAGIFKKRRNYVMIYWVASMVFTVLMILGLFTQKQSVGSWIFAFGYCVLEIYFQLVIRSYYLEMTGATQNQNPEQPPNPVARRF